MRSSLSFFYFCLVAFTTGLSIKHGQSREHPRPPRNTRPHGRVRVFKPFSIKPCDAVWSEPWTLLVGKFMRKVFVDEKNMKFFIPKNPCLPVFARPTCSNKHLGRYVEQIILCSRCINVALDQQCQ